MATTLLKPYVTVDNVKNNCGIDLSDTQHDDYIKAKINAASRLVDELTGRFYYEKTFTDIYINGIYGGSEGWWIANAKGSSGLIFTPQNAPIISVTSIIEDDIALTENTDYYIDQLNGMIQRVGGASWNKHPRTIKITCVLGYDSDDTATPSADIPGDIIQHSLQIASNLCGEYKKSVRSFVSGSVEEMELFGVPKDSEKYLKKFRQVRIR